MNKFSTGRHISLRDVTGSCYFRIEFFEAWSPERGDTGTVNANTARELVAGMDARGTVYRIFPIVFARCTATNL